MATISTIAIVHDGVIRIPQEVEADPGFREGARVRLIPVESSVPLDKTPPEVDWRVFEGMFADSSFDATEWKRQEREFELAHDERKSGTKRPEW
jgi:hypothetical protein